MVEGCDSRASIVRTRQVEFTSGRKDTMSSSVTAPLTCGGGRNMEAGQFGIQRLKSNWREREKEGERDGERERERETERIVVF